MKTVGKTLGVYFVIVLIIGIIIGLLHVANTTNPLNGTAYVLGFSLRIFYVTIPLLVGLYLTLRHSSKVGKNGEVK